MRERPLARASPAGLPTRLCRPSTTKGDVRVSPQVELSPSGEEVDLEGAPRQLARFQSVSRKASRCLPRDRRFALPSNHPGSCEAL